MGGSGLLSCGSKGFGISDSASQRFSTGHFFLEVVSIHGSGTESVCHRGGVRDSHALPAWVVDSPSRALGDRATRAAPHCRVSSYWFIRPSSCLRGRLFRIPLCRTRNVPSRACHGCCGWCSLLSLSPQPPGCSLRPHVAQRFAQTGFSAWEKGAKHCASVSMTGWLLRLRGVESL